MGCRDPLPAAIDAFPSSCRALADHLPPTRLAEWTEAGGGVGRRYASDDRAVDNQKLFDFRPFDSNFGRGDRVPALYRNLRNEGELARMGCPALGGISRPGYPD